MQKTLLKLYKPIQIYKNNQYLKKFLKENQDYSEEIRKLKDSHLNQRCFVIGNGPSLTSDDLDLISDEITFSCNMIFDLLEKTKWKPYYYFCHDPGYIRKIPNEIKNLKAEKKFIGYYSETVKVVDKVYKNSIGDIFYYIDKKDNDYRLVDFSLDVSKKCYPSGSVSYAILQFAVYMGFSEIYMIGFDHNLDSKTEQTHFDGYSGNQLSEVNIDSLTKGFIQARKAAVSKGIKIINCTRGGKLEVFERKSLEEVI